MKNEKDPAAIFCLPVKYFHQFALHESLGISWKAQKDQVNMFFPSTFSAEKRPYFPSAKNSKQELFSNQ